MNNTAENVREITVSQPVSSGALTPMDMLSHAVERGADLDMIEKLMNLQERWEASQARKAFDEAISAAKADIPPIERTGKGHNDKRYATFAAIAKVVDPIISQHGLSYRFRTTQGDRISVTCILSHKSGHFEETTLSGPPDASGSKNAIQAIGSTLTFPEASKPLSQSLRPMSGPSRLICQPRAAGRKSPRWPTKWRGQRPLLMRWARNWSPG
jgi:hypothetical protein